MILTRDISGEWSHESLTGMGSRRNGRRGSGNSVYGVNVVKKLFI